MSRVLDRCRNASEKLASLKKRGANEFRVRLTQALAQAGERGSLSLGLAAADDAMLSAGLPDKLRSAGALHEHFLAEADHVPWLGLRDISKTVAAVPVETVNATVCHADAIARGEIRLFGGQLLDYGDPIDWHREPRANRVTPRKHWGQIDYLNPAVAGDKKFIWEINRQQYLLTLGRAFVATRDDSYAAIFVDHVNAWMTANPPKIGINWASSLEVAIRAMTWVWALHMFRDSRRVTPAFLMKIIVSLDAQGRHVERYLSTYFSPNTHLTGEALGLYTIAGALPFLPSAQRWTKTARSILLAELRTQVRPDGTYFENATYYHRYTLDIYLHFAAMAAARGEPLDADALASIEALANALAALIRPDGTHGFLGDDDGGQLVPLDGSAINDFRPALSNAAVFLRSASLKAAAGGLAEETIWLLGPEARTTFDDMPVEERSGSSRALADGGYYVMRDGGGRQASQLIVDCGPHGAMNCGHAHADALAFEVVSRGRPALVDAGTFTYTGDARSRRAFRSTAFHNALTVDRQSSSEPAGPFNWHSKATCQTLRWATNGRFDIFEGAHDGFVRLPEPVTYRRGILFIKGEYWIVRDRADSSGPHVYTQHFHFAPDIQPQLVETGHWPDGVVCRGGSDGEPVLDILSFADGGRWAFEDGWVSTRYGDRQAIRSPAFSSTRVNAVDIVTFLVPGRVPGGGARKNLAIVENFSESCRTFRIGGGDEHHTSDVLALRLGDKLVVDDLRGDAEWVWVRRQNGRIESMVLHGITHLEQHGRLLLSAVRPVDMSLWRERGEICIDCTDVLNASGFDEPVRFVHGGRPAGNRERASMGKSMA